MCSRICCRRDIFFIFTTLYLAPPTVELVVLGAVMGDKNLPHVFSGANLIACIPVGRFLFFATPVDPSPLGFSVRGVVQARILKWLVVPASRGSSRPGIEPMSFVSPALASGFFTTSATWEA